MVTWGKHLWRQWHKVDPEGVGFLPPLLRALPSLTTDCLMSKLLYTCERSPFVSTRLDPGVPGIWYKHHSGNGCEDVVNTWIHRLGKADCPLSCRGVGLIKSVEALHKTEKLPLLRVKGNTPDSCLERDYHFFPVFALTLKHQLFPGLQLLTAGLDLYWSELASLHNHGSYFFLINIIYLSYMYLSTYLSTIIYWPVIYLFSLSCWFCFTQALTKTAHQKLCLRADLYIFEGVDRGHEETGIFLSFQKALSFLCCFLGLLCPDKGPLFICIMISGVSVYSS